MTQAAVTSLVGLVPVVVAAGVVLSVTDQVFKKKVKARSRPLSKRSRKTKAEANYTPRSKVEGQNCRGCEFFHSGQDTCTIVKGKIVPGGWCKYWEED